MKSLFIALCALISVAVEAAGKCPFHMSYALKGEEGTSEKEKATDYSPKESTITVDGKKMTIAEHKRQMQEKFSSSRADGAAQVNRLKKKKNKKDKKGKGKGKGKGGKGK